MPAANLLTDDGSFAGSVDPGSASVLRAGAQDVSTMANATSADNCNIHVALFALLGVALIVLLRKSGVHALSLEG
jgi:hypothetical protein